MLPGQWNVYISQGRILNLTQSPVDAPYTGFNQIDAAGKYLIPGLWDMHAHPDDPEVWHMDPLPAHRDWLLPQFVLFGVTGIRDMAGDMKVINDWREKGIAGDLPVPKIVACGPLLDGPNPMWDGSVGIDDTSRVSVIVDSLMLSGSDFLKVYSLLPRDIYLELAEYAKKVQVPLVGHVPLEVLPSEAAITGMKSQEHLLEVLKECSSVANDIRFGNIDYGSLTTGLEKYIFRQRLIMDTFDPDKFQKLAATFVATDTWITPTLSMWYKNAWYESEVQADTNHLKRLPPYLRKYWTPRHNDHLKYRDNREFIEVKKRLYSFYQKLLLDFHQAGVKIMTGTDMGANPLCFPGIGVHNEMEALVASGLSAAAALQAATINPVKFLDIAHDYGSIERGKVADLVILEANPLEDINNVREIWGVIHHGVLHDPEARSKQLKSIEQMMAEP